MSEETNAMLFRCVDCGAMVAFPKGIADGNRCPICHEGRLLPKCEIYEAAPLKRNAEPQTVNNISCSVSLDAADAMDKIQKIKDALSEVEQKAAEMARNVESVHMAQNPIIIEARYSMEKSIRESREAELSEKLGRKVVILDGGMHVYGLPE